VTLNKVIAGAEYSKTDPAMHSPNNSYTLSEWAVS